MKCTGPGKLQTLQNTPDTNLWSFEYDFGADVFKEAFGDADEPQTGLLWLANRAFETSAAVISVITSCGTSRRIKPE